MPWENATGSDSDAATLIRDLERVCDEEGLALQRREIPAPANTPHVDAAHLSAAAPEHARYDREGRTITVDVSQPAPEQAVALLRALCEHVGYDSPPRDELEGKIRRAAAESAKYAVASLYGLELRTRLFRICWSWRMMRKRSDVWRPTPTAASKCCSTTWTRSCAPKRGPRANVKPKLLVRVLAVAPRPERTLPRPAGGNGCGRARTRTHAQCLCYDASMRVTCPLRAKQPQAGAVMAPAGAGTACPR